MTSIKCHQADKCEHTGLFNHFSQKLHQVTSNLKIHLYKSIFTQTCNSIVKLLL